MTVKVRISAAVISHLEGSDAWQSGQACVESGYERQSTVDMMEAIKAAPVRKDGSVSVNLTAEQRLTLFSIADVMAIGAKDNIEPPRYLSRGEKNWALADFNAARALMRQIEKIDGPIRPRW